MQKQKGMGRTRLGRFAAITVPATVVTAGLGYAMLQGMVGATLSSANGFTLQSDAITTDTLKVRPGSAEDAAATAATDHKVATIYAETGEATKADGIDVVGHATLPILGAAHVEISSSDGNISLPSVVLNAKTLNVGTNNADNDNPVSAAASLSDVTLGVAQSDAGFSSVSGADNGADATGNGFALTAGHAAQAAVTDPETGEVTTPAVAASTQTLNNVDSTAYVIHLTGLSLSQLSLSVGLD